MACQLNVRFFSRSNVYVEDDVSLSPCDARHVPSPCILRTTYVRSTEYVYFAPFSVRTRPPYSQG